MQSASKRPLTVREIQAAKRAKREAEQRKIRVKNVSHHQPITVQLLGKNSKKATEQLSIHIAPGKSVLLPEARIWPEQIINLRKRGLIRTSKVGIRKKALTPEPVNQEEVKAKMAENVATKRPTKKKSKEKNKTKEERTNDG